MRFLGFICVFFSMIAGGCNGKSGGVVDKTLPPVRPETPKRILFVHNLFANTELNQMLLIADELRARGHYCKFLMVNQVEKKVRDKGFDFRGMDDKLDGGKFAEILGKLSVSKKWYEYVGGFGEFATTMAKGYETALLDIRDELVSNNNTKKQYDLVYTSMFSDMAVDLASHYNIPFVIHYACTMGAIFDYHDSVGAPDAFLWTTMEESFTFKARMQKILRTILMIASTIGAVTEKNAVRVKYGLTPYGPPLENWQHAQAVVVTTPLGMDVARYMHPKTTMTGFLAVPYQENSNAAGTHADDDKEMTKYLDKHPGGVVFCSLGSLARLTQAEYEEITKGMDMWVQEGKKRGAIMAVNEFAEKMLDLSVGPDSVKRVGWTNQPMILAHKNTAAFITHGGLGSIGEAVVSMVPMVVLPVFGDQMSNGIRLTEMGVAETLHHREVDVTAESVYGHLKSVTTDPSYMDQMRRLYQISVRLGGVQKAADVVEDVLLLDGNSDHLTPIEDYAPFLARTNLDVYAVLLGIVGAVVFAIVWVLGKIFKTLRSGTQTYRKVKKS